MRDNRQSTEPNGVELPPPEISLDYVPELFAARLRAARQSAGMSQEALAKAMRERGMNWRQTTVAKTEKADRPVLFVEAITLSRIFGRGVEEFFTPMSALDELVDGLRAEVATLGHEFSVLEFQVMRTKAHLEDARITQRLAHAALRYKNDSDSGALRDEVDSLVATLGERVLEAPRRVWEALEVTPEEIAEVDRIALFEAVQAEAGRHRAITVDEKMPSVSYAGSLLGFLSGEPVDEEFLVVIRTQPAWTAYVGQLLTDLLVNRIAIQR